MVTRIKKKLAKQSGIFLNFSRAFEKRAQEAELQAEKERTLAKVCRGLHRVCSMLAGERKPNG